MIRNNKGKLILTSLVTLLPILAGLMLWDELPAQMAIHWGLDGQADGWGGRAAVVFATPLIFLAAHWVCVLVTAADPGNRRQSPKALGLVFWICPVLSLFVGATMYTTAFGMDFSDEKLHLVLLSLMFLVLGNYLPKCRQNYSLGIKIKWALEDEENWNATHRLGGRLWVGGGLLMLACVFLPDDLIPVVMVVLLVAMALIPTVYSYAFYRRKVRQGLPVVQSADLVLPPHMKWIRNLVLGGVALMLVWMAVVCFTGNIQVEYGQNSFTVRADHWADSAVAYDQIDRVEYREEDQPGRRVGGFGSPRLLMGAFENEEFGQYTRYSYTGCESCVVLTVGDKVMVLSGRDADSTRAIYEQLISRVN